VDLELEKNWRGVVRQESFFSTGFYRILVRSLFTKRNMFRSGVSLSVEGG